MPYTSEFPPFYVAVDMVVLADDAERPVLLIRRGNPPYEGRLALPGGFVEPDESLDDAARRELYEETGVDVGDAVRLEQLGAYGAPDRDPRARIVSVAYLAVVRGRPAANAGDDAADAQWHRVDGITTTNLAFDHAKMLADALGRLSRA